MPQRNELNFNGYRNWQLPLKIGYKSIFIVILLCNGMSRILNGAYGASNPKWSKLVRNRKNEQEIDAWIKDFHLISIRPSLSPQTYITFLFELPLKIIFSYIVKISNKLQVSVDFSS